MSQQSHDSDGIGLGGVDVEDSHPIKKSAVQVIRPKSEPQPLSPSKKKGTIKITKIVLKDKGNGINKNKPVVKSKETYTTSAISYTKSILTENPNKKVLSQDQQPYQITPLPVKRKDLIEEFENKKSNRERVSNDFQNYLIDSFKENSPFLNVEKEGTSSSAMNLSDTVVKSISPTPDIKITEKVFVEEKKSFKPFKAKSNKPMSAVKKPETEVTVKKEKSYDTEKAREYIKEQQQKRKIESKTKNVTKTVEKDLIKKRLEELRKSTLTLVEKNIKNRKNSLKSENSNEKIEEIKEIKVKKKKETPPVCSRRCSSAATTIKSSNVVSKKSPPNSAPTSQHNTTSKTTSSFRKKPDLSQKMGILRKPDHIAIEPLIISPLSINKTSERQKPFISKVSKINVDAEDKSEDNTMYEIKSISDIEKELKLDVPEFKLVQTNMTRVNIKSTLKQDKTVPSWLKQTLIHPDPYPFIFAVRKKLEAIKNTSYAPIHHNNYTQTSVSAPENKYFTPKSLPVIHDLSTIKKSDFRREKSQDNNRKCYDYLEMLKKVPFINKKDEDYHEPATLTEINTNISSISVHVSESNTISEISSIKSDPPPKHQMLSSTKIDEKYHHESINLSPVKEIMSPLQTDRISSMKLSKINQHRGSDMLETETIPNRISFDDKNVNKNLENFSLNNTDKYKTFIGATASKNEEKETTSSSKNEENEAPNLDISQREMDLRNMLHTFNEGIKKVLNVQKKLFENPPPLTIVDRIQPPKEAWVKKPEPIKIRDEGTQTISIPVNNSNYSDDFEKQNSKTSDDFDEKLSISNTSHQQTITSSNNKDETTTPDTFKSEKDDQYSTHSKTSSQYSSTAAYSISEEPKEEDEKPPGNIDTSIDTEFSKDSTLKKSITINYSENHLMQKNNNENKELEISIKDLNNTTAGSEDILALLNKTDFEASFMSTTISETNLSYSSIGMYDQLIQNEKSKSDHLSSLVKLREKQLLDRTKGQLAWLELQKQKFKKKGMAEEISAIKRKQRAIIVRLDKERANIHKMSKVQSRPSKTPLTPQNLEKFNAITSNSTNTVSLRKSSINSSTVKIAIKGIEIEPNEKLEDILQKREEELKKRKEHVESLLKWHHKLDKEEQEIMEMENKLLQYNKKKISNSEKITNRIKTIEKSLETLQGIPSDAGAIQNDYVKTEGVKLNKLWKRLTSYDEIKYEPERSYILTKQDLETLYESAKAKVLETFQNDNNIPILLDQTIGVSENIDVQVEEELEDKIEELETENNSTTNDASTLKSDSTLFEESSQSDGVESSKTVKNVVEEAARDEAEFLIEDIISKVSDITEDIHEILSSQTNIDEILDNQNDSPELSQRNIVSRQEMHTMFNKITEDTEQLIENVSFPYDDSISFEHDEETENADEISTQKSDNEVEEDKIPHERKIADKNSDDIAEDILSVSNNSRSSNENEHDETFLVKAGSSSPNSSELEKRLIILNDGLEELSETFEKVPIMEVCLKSPEHDSLSSTIEEEYSTDNDFQNENPSSIESVSNSSNEASATAKIDAEPASNSSDSYKLEIKIRNKNINEGFPAIARDFSASSVCLPSTSASVATSANRMPDIINEAEVLRRQQLQIEQEIKQLEQQVQVPYVFFREIPNKPPPPYIPPANGSPLSLIFPPKERVDELVTSRIEELYKAEQENDLLNHQNNENITNVYEKLILELCQEFFEDIKPQKQDVSYRMVKEDKRPLAFFKPPNDLECMIIFIRKRVDKILNPENFQQHQPPFMFSCAKRKRDHVDEVLVQEMIEDENKWTNFDREEIEVKNDVTNEIFKMLLDEAIIDIENAFNTKICRKD